MEARRLFALVAAHGAHGGYDVDLYWDGAAPGEFERRSRCSPDEVDALCRRYIDPRLLPKPA